MPLRSRRRHKKPAALQNTDTHPPAKSPLEVLPVEILLKIFLESQNPSVVLISKTIYSLIGHKPSDWLLLEFFSYGRKGIVTLYLLLTSRPSYLRWSRSSSRNQGVYTLGVYQVDKSVRSSRPVRFTSGAMEV